LTSNNSTIEGILSGAGTIDENDASIEVGATLAVANLSLNGTLYTDISYGDDYVASGDLNLNASSFTLTGMADLTDGAFSGPGTLLIDTTSAEIAPELLDGATLEIESSIGQVGDAELAGASTIQIDQGASYSIVVASRIGFQDGPSNSLMNNGTLVDDSDGGTSSIDIPFTNNGTIIVDSGDTLVINGTETLGGTIEGAGTLVLGDNITFAPTSLSVSARFNSARARPRRSRKT
jgi:hypothetical protein